MERPAPKSRRSGVTIEIVATIKITPRKLRRILAIAVTIAALAIAAKSGAVVTFFV